MMSPERLKRIREWAQEIMVRDRALAPSHLKSTGQDLLDMAAELEDLNARVISMEAQLQGARNAVVRLTTAAVDVARELGEPAQQPVTITTTPCICGNDLGMSCAAARHPCGDSCTHPDASTVGHPERIRELSAAVSRGE